MNCPLGAIGFTSTLRKIGERCQLLRRTSLWRPIRGPVTHWPLALCDNSNLDTDTIEVGDVVFEDFTINNEYIRFNPAQKWYYVSEQQASEAWVFVQGDAEPHTRHGISISITTDCLSLTYILGKEFLIRRFR
jgi:hypothetical protein